jgi:hypothetical protein
VALPQAVDAGALVGFHAGINACRGLA